MASEMKIEPKNVSENVSENGKRELTCIECPMGCRITVTVESGKVVSVTGNTCKRGKLYAENEVTCPMRVLTTTVRHESGAMLPVKTDRPIKKAGLFDAMAKIRKVTAEGNINVGDVIVAEIADGAALVAADGISVK